jgi:hypothetical protein
MKRVYHGKTIEIGIYPSGRDQADVGMFVDMERNGWKNSIFIPDTIMARVIGREMYYALVCEFFPNDFQSRPSTPEMAMVYKRIRKRSSSSRIRKTPQEFGVEAEPYDKGIIDAVEQSSLNADIGEARLRVERSVFQSIQDGLSSTETADRIWWDVKFKITLIVVCLKYHLLNPPSDHGLTFGEIFQFWRNRTGMSDREMYHQEDGSLTQIGQSVVEGVESKGMLGRLLGGCRAYGLLNEELLTVQNTNAFPEIEGQSTMTVDQSRIIQIILVIILFGVLVAGVGSFLMENRKIMGLLEKIHDKCKP